MQNRSCLGLLVYGTLLAQSQIHPEQVERGVNVNRAAGEQLLFYGLTPSAGEVAAVSTGNNNVRITRPGEQDVLLTAVNGAPEVFGDNLIFSKLTGAVGEPWVLDLRSGKTRPIELPLNPMAIAASGDRLAIAGLSNGNTVTLAILDADLKPFAMHTLALSKTELLGALLFWQSGSRLVLADTSAASYVVINPRTGQLGSRTVLSGSEIDLCKSKAQATPSVGRGFKEVILRGHVSGKGGNDLFFLGPYKGAEGFTLVEFNREGVPQSSYRLGIPDYVSLGPATASFSRHTVAGKESVVEVVSMDGMKRRYRLP